MFHFDIELEFLFGSRPGRNDFYFAVALQTLGALFAGDRTISAENMVRYKTKTNVRINLQIP